MRKLLTIIIMLNSYSIFGSSDRLKSVNKDEIKLGQRLDSHAGGKTFEVIKVSNNPIEFQYEDS